MGKGKLNNKKHYLWSSPLLSFWGALLKCVGEPISHWPRLASRALIFSHFLWVYMWVLSGFSWVDHSGLSEKSPGKKNKGILYMPKERLFPVCPCWSWSEAMLPWSPEKQLELEVGWIRKTLKWYLRGVCLLLYIFLMVLFKANTLPPDIVNNLFHSLTYNWCIFQEAPSWGEGYAWVWFSEDLSRPLPEFPEST